MSKKKKGLGIETKIKNMDPKLKKLFENIISMMMILMVVYGVITFILVFINSGSFMMWFNTEHFLTTILVIVFLGLAHKILKGGKIAMPQQSEQKKATFHIPDTYGVRGKGLGLGGEQPQQQSQQQQPQQLNIPNYFGAKPQQQNLQQQPQQLNVPNYLGQKPQQQPKSGSWKCPKCSSAVIGNKCRKCGYQRG